MKKIDASYRNALSVELVAAYIRVSTQEQKLHGLSLDAQIQKIEKYAEEHNMKIVEWYKDEGVSGRKLIRNRPELQRMIQDAEKGNFSRIIFIKLDRFFRSVAEYHECMKRISPVIWSTTDEEYDLTTANGRMLVNMKLTIAEMEADMTGERIDIVNEYKVSTGQPLSGSQPLGFTIGTDATTGRKKVVKDATTSAMVEDLIQHYLTFQSKKRTLIYAHQKYHLSIGYSSIGRFLSNTMLYGKYRGNPQYCDPYITKETFDKMQEIMKRNIKENTAENRTYIFSGMIRCPECGCLLKGTTAVTKSRDKSKSYTYKRYRCGNRRRDGKCGFTLSISENVFERMMLAEIEGLFENEKMQTVTIQDGGTPLPRYDIDEINARIDRLNYSWQTGKIRTVEQYEKDFVELTNLLEEAMVEQKEVVEKDFTKIEGILQTGWKGIYEALDETHQQAFWRSFVASIEIDWTTQTRKIKRVIFF